LEKQTVWIRRDNLRLRGQLGDFVGDISDQKQRPQASSLSARAKASMAVPLSFPRGYKVSIVQNPTTSLAADVAATNQILDEQDGDVVLVGHSYGGW
jgi:pimeloyl-ACP methyl ester carboxylesterase